MLVKLHELDMIFLLMFPKEGPLKKLRFPTKTSHFWSNFLGGQ